MSILPFANQNVYELVAYQPGKPIEETARELGLSPEEIVKLASNENSLGPSPLAVQAMQQAAAGSGIQITIIFRDIRIAQLVLCGASTGHQCVNITTCHSNGQQAYRCEHRETATHIVRHNKGFVAFAVGQRL